MFIILFAAGCDSVDLDEAGADSAPFSTTTTVTVPVTAGASQFNYGGLSSANQHLAPTFDHPVGGLVSPLWLGRVPPSTWGTNTYTYEELGYGHGSTDNERMLWVAQQMLTADTPNNAPPSITSATLTLGSGIELWNGAFIAASSGAGVTVLATVTANFTRSGWVELRDDEAFAVRGGREGGVFTYVEGATYQPAQVSNIFDRDAHCTTSPGGSSTQTPNTVGVATGPQGARMKIGAYLQIGELFLYSNPAVCDGWLNYTASMVDVESLQYNLFRRASNTTVSINGGPASAVAGATSQTNGSSITFNLSLPALNAGESIASVHRRNDNQGSYTPVTGVSGSSFSVTATSAKTYIVVTTTSGRIARAILTSVFASID